MLVFPRKHRAAENEKGSGEGEEEEVDDEDECVYLNETYNPVSGKTMRQWSTAGCNVSDANSTHVTCLCNHLTDFGTRLVSSVESVGRVVTQLGSDTIDQKAGANLGTIFIMSGLLAGLFGVLLATRVKLEIIQDAD